MKSVSEQTYNTIRESYAIDARAKVMAEWNLNRYYPMTIDNTPSEKDASYNEDLFPLASVIKPDRPVAGIIKAVANQSKTATRYRDVVPSARYYVSSPNDVYKYWNSPYPADADGYIPNHTDGSSSVRVAAEYAKSTKTEYARVTCNKINITVENTWAKPVEFTVQVKTTRSSPWRTIATNPEIRSDGQIKLYYDGTNWISTPNYDNSTTLGALRLVVTKMNKPNAYFSLIEMGLRLEKELSEDVVGINDSASLGDVDFITPLGTVSSNEGSLVLRNDDQRYAPSFDSDQFYRRILDKKAIIKAWYIFDGEEVKQFELETQSWVPGQYDCTVNLADASRYLQEAKPPQLFYTDIPVQEAIYKMLDSVGYTRYKVDFAEDATNPVIDVFWTTGEQTVWEVVQELSKAFQMAMYYDADGFFRISPREVTWNYYKEPIWDIRGDSREGVPDLIEFSEESQYEANKVTVTYKPTHFSRQTGNVFPYETAWEPGSDNTDTTSEAADSDIVTLSTSALVKNFLKDDISFWFTSEVAASWPWKGIAQIQGEFVEYEGKTYLYYLPDGTQESKILKSYEEQKALDDASPPLLAYANKYTGEMIVKTRGMWNSGARDHYYQTNFTSWAFSKWSPKKVIQTKAPGITQHTEGSQIRISTGASDTTDTITMMQRGSISDQGYYHLGTRVKMPNAARPHNQVGIIFNSPGTGSGYYLDIVPTAKLGGALRGVRNEVVLFSQKGASRKAFGGESITDTAKKGSKAAVKRFDKGAQVAIVQNTWFDIDIHFNITPSGDHHIITQINGTTVLDSTVPKNSGWLQPWTARTGIYCRGASEGLFEYFYSVTDDRKWNDYTDDTSYFDMLRGGYASSSWMLDWVHDYRKIRTNLNDNSTIYYPENRMYYDEFGAIAHEMRLFDVKFDKEKPVLQSKLYSTNNQVACTEYIATPFGAKFYLVNISRNNAVINGEDTLTYGEDNSVDQKLLVYGRPALQDNDKTVTEEDLYSQDIRGVIETEYNSKWMQNETAAQSLATWATTQWSTSTTGATVTLFSNPLLELCDVIVLKYAPKSEFDPLYWIVGKSASYEKGVLETEYTLRLKK